MVRVPREGCNTQKLMSLLSNCRLVLNIICNYGHFHEFTLLKKCVFGQPFLGMLWSIRSGVPPSTFPTLLYLPPHPSYAFASKPNNVEQTAAAIRLSHLSDSGEKRGEAELIMLFCGYAATEWSKINFTRLQNESSSVPVPDRYVSRHIFASLCSVVYSLNPVCNPFAWREESLSKRASLPYAFLFLWAGMLPLTTSLFLGSLPFIWAVLRSW